jgi:hypothetical protein
MHQSKDTEQQTGFKNKTQPYVAYKRLISLKKINTGLASRVEKGLPSKDLINRQK